MYETVERGRRLTGMAERALTDPSADIEAVFGRLGDLLAIIDFHSETLSTWFICFRRIRASRFLRRSFAPATVTSTILSAKPSRTRI